jgi:hypothetical protein
MSASPGSAPDPAGDLAVESARAELESRCDAIEGCYEFMLAYAAQGMPTDVGSSTGQQVRVELERCTRALTGLSAFISRYIDQLNVPSKGPYEAFLAVLERDALDAQAMIGLVLAQPAIGSQLIDNLNASIHVRALLTDLFIVDEALKGLPSQA